MDGSIGFDKRTVFVHSYSICHLNIGTTAALVQKWFHHMQQFD